MAEQTHRFFEKLKSSAAANKVAIVLIVLSTVGLIIDGIKHGADFHVFCLASQRLWKGAPIYQAADGWMPFKYHPFWAVAFLPAIFLHEKISLVIFLIVQLICWWLGARIWAKWLGYDIKKPVALFFLVLASFSAMAAETGFGQVNGFLFFGSTKLFDWLESRPQRPFASGLLMSVLFALKLNFGVLIIYCLIKNWRTIFGIVAGIFLMHAAVAVFTHDPLNAHIYHEWLELLLTQSSRQYDIFEAQGFLRFFRSILGDNGKYLWAATVLIFLSGGLVIERGRFQKPQVPGIFWLAGTYLVSPLAWWYQILFMYPLVFWLFKQPLRKLERRLTLLCFVVYSLVTFNTLGHDGIMAFKLWQGYFFCSVLLAILLVKLLILQVRSTKLSSSLTSR